MEFIKNLFGKKEEPVEKLAGLEEAEAWLRTKEKKALLMPDTGQVLEDIRSLLTELGESIKELEEAEIPKDTSSRLRKLGEKNRENMLRHLKEIHNGISPPGDCGFRSVSSFYRSAFETLKQGTERSLRSHYYVKAVFDSDANKVIVNIKRLEALILKLKEPVEKRGKLVDSIERCSNELSELKSNNSKLSEIRAGIESASRKMSELDREKNELEKKIASMKAGPDWEGFEALKCERVEVLKAIEAIECECSYFFAPFSKAIEKLEKLSTSGRYPLSTEQKELLSKNFLEYSRTDIKEFAAWIPRTLSDGSVQLKQKAVSRINEKLPLFKGMLEKYQKERLRLLEKKSKLESSLDGCEIRKQVKAMEWKMTQLSKERAVLSPEKLEKKRQGLLQEISLEERRLADHVNAVAGKKVEFSIIQATRGHRIL